jgi:phosphoribosylglycinamide formyltransferase-1
MKRIVILISGRGSNLKAILQSTQNGTLNTEVAAVISNQKNAQGLDIAREFGINAISFDHKDFASREAFDQELITTIDQLKPDLVVLAGFMRLLTDHFVDHFEGRLINIHPSLLPSFPGLRTHEQAIAKGVKWHGATVHFVSKEMDEGPIIIQGVVPVLPGDTPEILADRVLEIEHRIYVQAIKWYIDDQLRLEKGIVSVIPTAPQFFAINEKS